MVKFSVRNRLDAPIKVKTGDTEMTLAPGKDVPVKLAIGAQLVAEEARHALHRGHGADGGLRPSWSDTLVLK